MYLKYIRVCDVLAEEEVAKAEMHKGRVGAAIQEQEAQLTATRKELQDHIKNNRRTG